MLMFCSFDTAAKGNTYSVYIVPQVSPITLHKNWIPFLNKLGEVTGFKFELKLQHNFAAFEDALFRGIPDFVFMNPHQQLQASKKHGYIPILRDAKKKLIGIIVVNQDSPIQSIEQLRNQEVAFPTAKAFAASLYNRALLVQKNIHLLPHYVNTHSNVYRSVLIGDFIAGGWVNNTFERQPDNIKKQLRIIFKSPATASHPFSVHPRISAEVREKVVKHFLLLAEDQSNKKLLHAIQMPLPEVADYVRDYQPLEALGLDDNSNENVK
jgi:phosphonate transport system substrate-binding protein